MFSMNSRACRECGSRLYDDSSLCITCYEERQKRHSSNAQQLGIDRVLQPSVSALHEIGRILTASSANEDISPTDFTDSVISPISSRAMSWLDSIASGRRHSDSLAPLTDGQVHGHAPKTPKRSYSPMAAGFARLSSKARRASEDSGLEQQRTPSSSGGVSSSPARRMFDGA